MRGKCAIVSGLSLLLGALVTIAAYEVGVLRRRAIPADSRAERQKDCHDALHASPCPTCPDHKNAVAPNEDSSKTESSGQERRLVLARELASQYRSENQKLERQISALQSSVDYLERAGSNAYPEEYELDADGWRRLAEQQTVHYRVPCALPDEAHWPFRPETLDELGLSPEDGEIVNEAIHRSTQRVWKVVGPACAVAAGSQELAEALGINPCMRLLDSHKSAEGVTAVADVQRRVALVRAGDLPMPAPDEEVEPLFEALLAMTLEGKKFEADLTQHFGPDEAKRIWYGLDCASTRR